MIIRTETFVAAPVQKCFDLKRDVRAHAASAAGTRERVVQAPPSGLLELGDEVEFEAVHLGLKLRLRSKIVEFQPPSRFVDEMQRGPFKRLRHVHEFRNAEGGTVMVDEMDFASPAGALGALIDRLFMGNHMRRFLIARNLELKRMLESGCIGAQEGTGP